MQIELRVVVEMTNDQIEDYAEEFDLSTAEVPADVASFVKSCVAESTKSLHWTATILNQGEYHAHQAG